jgi:hypothetical protein
MTYVQTETARQSELVLRVLMHPRERKINHSTACFAENFSSTTGALDWGSRICSCPKEL